MNANRLTQLLGTRYPIVQAGMIWCSGWRLASAVSDAGGLGVIGAGSMYPSVLDEHIQKCQTALNGQPFAVNLPLLYPNIAEHIDTIIRHRVPVVITSAGNPRTYTAHLQQHGIKVIHVVASAAFAQKAAAAGVDAVVAEGFEAGGHNGREETTTMCLLPLVRQAVDIPLIAAGGIANGAGILAAMVLGADGVQMGTRFIPTHESSAHDNFKQKVLSLHEGDTMLALKKLVSVRLIKNEFYAQVAQAEARGATADELLQLLGRGRAKLGMFEGNMEQGELEVGQIAALLDHLQAAADVVRQLVAEFDAAVQAVATRFGQ